MVVVGITSAGTTTPRGDDGALTAAAMMMMMMTIVGIICVFRGYNYATTLKFLHANAAIIFHLCVFLVQLSKSYWTGIG